MSCAGAESRELDKSLATRISVGIGHTVLPVSVPARIGDSTSKRAYAAGSVAAQKIPLGRRVAFTSLEAAIAGGFTVGRTTKAKGVTKRTSTRKKGKR